MSIDDLIYSEDLRNCLMDIIKCANDEYQDQVKGANESGSISKDALYLYEQSLRKRLYSVLLGAFDIKNEWSAQDAFTDLVSSFLAPLRKLAQELELDTEAKKVVAATLATCVAAATEDTRNMKFR
jgi:hypothetical protein